MYMCVCAYGCGCVSVYVGAYVTHIGDTDIMNNSVLETIIHIYIKGHSYNKDMYFNQLKALLLLVIL